MIENQLPTSRTLKPVERQLLEVEGQREVARRQLANGGRLGTALLDRGITRLIVGRKAAGGFGYLSMTDAGVPALPDLPPLPAGADPQAVLDYLLGP